MEKEKQLQWFPGHMAKTLRQMEKSVREIDVIVEILDSRIPYSSQNPVLKRIGKHKNRIYLLSKADLADPVITEKWIHYFNNMDSEAIAINTKQSKTRTQLASFLEGYFQSHMKSFKYGKPRLMFVGVPNVGKSSVINSLLGERTAKVEDRPGVTRGKQWFTTAQYEMLDMPGVLWPKFEDEYVGYNLAYTGAIKDDIFDIESVSSSLLRELMKLYPSSFVDRVGIEYNEEDSGYGLLIKYAKKRGFLSRGGELDTERAAHAVLYDLRNGKFGQISLEEP